MDDTGNFSLFVRFSIPSLTFASDFSYFSSLSAFPLPLPSFLRSSSDSAVLPDIDLISGFNASHSFDSGDCIFLQTPILGLPFVLKPRELFSRSFVVISGFKG